MGSQRVGPDWNNLARMHTAVSSNAVILFIACSLISWNCQVHDCVDHNKLWKILQEMGIPDHLTCSWEIYMQVKKQQSEPDMEQWTCSKLGKEYVKAVYCHCAYLTYMQSTSCEMPGWMKHKLESRLPGEISIISDTQMTSPLWQKVKRN